MKFNFEGQNYEEIDHTLDLGPPFWTIIRDARFPCISEEMVSQMKHHEDENFLQLLETLPFQEVSCETRVSVNCLGPRLVRNYQGVAGSVTKGVLPHDLTI